MAAPVHYADLVVPGITDSNLGWLGRFKSFTGLEIDCEIYEFAEGGNNDFVHRLPGRLRYPNLVLSWGIIDADALLKWFAATQAQAQLREVTLTLASHAGTDAPNKRIFSFMDAFPVRWTGPQVADTAAEYWGESLEIAHSGMKLS